MSLRIAIADDHPVLLAGIAHLLRSEADLDVVGMVKDSTALVALVSGQEVDVVVTDFSMPHGQYGDGIAMLRFLQRRFPQTRLVVLTGMESPLVLNNILAAGVECIVSKSDPIDEVLPALRMAWAQGAYLSPQVRARLAPDVGTDDQQCLSKREKEVLRMYAEGLSVIEIATRIGRSRKTISTQKVAAMRKLGLVTDADVFQYAIAHGLVNASQQARAKAVDAG
ncbi:response regulator transcription factor [Stenotrophomonas sp. SORGH_AS_0321]|uniref:response regulator transcription factor n=1 Tax=Stenotrophomonas sp. SORGH_AS_0321 TaxID=3041787 RepID=UPI00285B8D41|nr:response regulator transcription factor [Stenotrophomonas sp. SORGH_AS_0321]MDR6094606.1 two-component system capsular synthesis response regulator RcsB [Stenotrophomonas sp. SORGH_AS_0321]